MDKSTTPSSNIKHADRTNSEASQNTASTSSTPDLHSTSNKTFGPAPSKSLLNISAAHTFYLQHFRQFAVIIWKNLVVRKRSYIATFIELISPCFFLLLLFLIKPLLSLDATGTDYKGYLRANEVIPLQNIMAPQLVLYSPATLLTGNLMDRAGQMMGLTRLTVFPDKKSRGYYAIPDESLLFVNDLVEKMSFDSVIVIFQGLKDEKECPVKLDYTIRMKKDLIWVEDYDDMETNDLISEPILRLQASIDFSFLDLCSSKQVKYRASPKVPVSINNLPGSIFYLETANMSSTVALAQFPLYENKNKSRIFLVCSLLRMVCPLALMLPFVFLFRRLIQERAFGVQELLKQVGVPFDIWLTSHIFNMFLTELCYSVCGTIICKVTSTPFLPNSNGLLLFTFFELHFHSIMMFAFMCSYVTKTGEYSTTLAVAAFVMSSVPARLLEDQELPGIVQHLTGILPHVPVMWFWWEVEALEIKGKGLHLKDIWTHHSKYSQSAMVAYIWMTMQILVFYGMSGYLNSVCPGKYGTSKPWNYLFKRNAGFSPIALQEVQNVMIQKDKRYFEESYLPNVGISIDNVTKIYGKDIIFSKISFNMYQGEITVLLGHNGAGKSTLLSIITGMVPLTSGEVYVNGMNISQDKTKVRSVMGICPQADMLVPKLTVMEHVWFFSMLKGYSWEKSKDTSKLLLQKLGIMDEKDYIANELSSGKKRRVQLACALSGGSNVLILDEPTSGLDVETRRELWNLLLSLRGQRTVLLTTHYMEEAEALGDRVAVLHGGKLQSHASPMYLKKTIGMGYRLSLTTTRRPQAQKITALVKSVLPHVKIINFSKRTISYSLPAQDSDKFPLLFTRLEEKRAKLEILTIGVGVSSLEEVFMKLCRDEDIQSAQDAVDIGLPETKFTKIYGVVLYGRQMCVLMRRQFRFLVFRKYSFLILEIIIPLTILMVLFLNLGEREKKKQTEPKKLSALNLDVYGDQSKNTVLLRLNSLDAFKAVEKLEDEYSNVEFVRTRDVGETVFGTSKVDYSNDRNNGMKPKNYIVGIEISDSKAKVMYNKSAHAAPLALNLLSNILAAQYIPRSGGITITTNYQPLVNNFLPLKNETEALLLSSKALRSCILWICIIIVIVLPTVSNSLILSIIERETGIRHIHIMSGCPPFVHWMATLLFQTLVYTIVLLLPATLLSFLDREATFNNSVFIGSLLLILVVGCMAYMVCCYLVSFKFARGGAGLLLSQLSIGAGIVPGVILFIAQVYRTDFPMWMIIFSNLLYYIFPVATLTVASLKAANVARLSALCRFNYDLCDNMILPIIFKKLPTTPETKGFDPQKCCALGSKKCILCFDEFAPGYELIILGLQTAVYFTLVVLAQHGIISGIIERIFNFRYKPTPTRYKDKQVEMEKIYVDIEIRKPLNELKAGENAMLVHDLHKNYFKFCRKNSIAVKGVSFSVKKGECFGFFGVDGSGKSSIFKMITGEQVHTRGHVYSTGQLLSFPRKGKYLHSLGYSPQYIGLDEFQSGYGNLATLMTLRGLQSDDVTVEARKWIDVVGLTKYQDVLVADYSGGCVRRLTIAAALSSDAPVTLLDELTCGVDVAARRKVWLALRKSLRENRAVIITSHSIDEMEAICDRIAIISSGEMCALGSAPALRAAYTSGHTLSIKLKSTGISPQNNQKLKVALREKFNCTLKDNRITMLIYHIKQTMAYSDIFSSLEQLKQSFPDVIEDYSVTETTLEEVFLSFTQPAPPERS